MELEKVVRKIGAQCKEKYKGNIRFAFFNDANNDLQIVCIISYEDLYGIGADKYKFISFNKNFEKTGFINIEVEKNNVYLAEVYTMTSVRGRGIAKGLSHIMDYYLKNMNKQYIYGFYMPQQMSDDLRKKVVVEGEELNTRARSFYESAGFKIMDVLEFENSVGDGQIISFDDSYFNVYSSFMLGEETVIVFKDISDLGVECGYHLEGDFLVQNGLNNEELNLMIKKEYDKINKLKELLLSFGWSESKVERFLELDKEYDLLNGSRFNDRKLPKDIVLKIKEITYRNKTDLVDIYSSLYDIYISMKDRGIVVKR